MLRLPRGRGRSRRAARWSYEWKDPAYADMVDNEPFMALYAANARPGRPHARPTRAPPTGVVGSTDMGNVSHLVPSIHPMIQVSPPNVAIHTADFVRYAGGEEGDQAVLDGAKTLACTVADLWLPARQARRGPRRRSRRPIGVTPERPPGRRRGHRPWSAAARRGQRLPSAA